MPRRKTADETAADREEHRFAFEDLQDAVHRTATARNGQAARANLRRAREREQAAHVQARSDIADE